LLSRSFRECRFISIWDNGNPSQTVFEPLSPSPLRQASVIASLATISFCFSMKLTIAQPLGLRDVGQIVEWLAGYQRAWAAVAVRQLGGSGESLLESNSDLGFSLLELEPIGAPEIVQFFERNTREGPLRAALLAIATAALDGMDDGMLGMFESPFNLELLSMYSFGNEPIPANESILQRATLAAAYIKEERAAPNGASFQEFRLYVGKLAVETLLRPPGRVPPRTADLRGPSGSVEFYQRLASTLNVFQIGPLDQRPTTWTGRMLSYFAGEFLLSRCEQLAELLPAPTYPQGHRRSNRIDESVHDVIRLDADAFDSVTRHDPCLASACLQDVPAARRAGAIDFVVARLVELLTTDNENCRSAATEALAAIGPDAVPPLRGAMERGEYWLRRRLIWALCKIDDTSAIELILRALADVNKRVSAAAESAILAFGTSQRDHVETLIARYRGRSLSPDDREALRRLGMLSSEFAPSVSDVLGIEITVTADAVVVEADIVDEPMAGEGSGLELVAQLRAVHRDSEMIARCYAWLRRTSMRDRTWAHVWSAVWDELGSDSGMEKLGRQWLTSVPDMAGSWGHVWIRLANAYPDDDTLMMEGRRWLSQVDSAHFAWPYVWRKITTTTPGDREINDMGLSWLRTAREGRRNWSVVWALLRTRAGSSNQLDQIAESLLRTTPPADLAWGYEWTDLFEADTGNKGLYELGRGWLGAAPPSHPAWGYVWPLMWRAQPRDAAIESLGREWLQRAPPTHAGWSFVWNQLWISYPNDRALLTQACTWLDRVPAAHESWAQVWKPAWEVAGRDSRLEALASLWLGPAGAPLVHPGWPWVFGLLAKCLRDDDLLAERGRAWLRDVDAGIKGWENVWLATWNRKPRLASDSESTELRARGRKWLESTNVEHEGFSHVWDVLWSIGPDDTLRRLALDHLWKNPADTTLMYIWLPLSRALPDDLSLTKQGIALLRGAIPTDHKQWNAIWADLWTRTVESDEVREIGTSWLSSGVGTATGWGNVWKCLWEAHPGDATLVSVGIQGLKGKASDHLAWKAVWRQLFAFAGTANRELLATSIKWLGTPESHRVEDFWLEVARPLAKAGELPDDLLRVLRRRDASEDVDDLTRERCQRINSTYSYTVGWWKEWQAEWFPNSQSLLVSSALRWLTDAANDQRQKGFPYEWFKIYKAELERAALIDVGLRWLRARDSRVNGWGLVWSGVMRSVPLEPDLARQGLEWLDQSHLSRGTWPEVWMTLWDLDLAERDILVEAGLAWLSRPNPTRKGYASVWVRLWDVQADSAQLRALSGAFIDLANTHEGWIDVILRIGIARSGATSLLERVAEWRAQNQGHPLARQVSELMTKRDSDG